MLNVYGVGRGTFTAGPALSSTGFSSGTTVDDSQIQGFLQAGIQSGSLLPYQPGTLYIVYTPPGMEVTQDSQTSQRFSGYHTFIPESATGPAIPYAVIVYPGQGNLLQPTEGVQGQLTRSTSHELAESVTDPFLDSWKDYQPGPEMGEEIADEVEGYDAYLAATRSRRSPTPRAADRPRGLGQHADHARHGPGRRRRWDDQRRGGHIPRCRLDARTATRPPSAMAAVSPPPAWSSRRHRGSSA